MTNGMNRPPRWDVRVLVRHPALWIAVVVEFIIQIAAGAVFSGWLLGAALAVDFLVFAAFAMWLGDRTATAPRGVVGFEDVVILVFRPGWRPVVRESRAGW